MGYSTEFEGAISIEPPLDLPLYQKLNDFADEDDRRATDGRPDSYCQWTPTKDGTGLKWDGNEKFYLSAEWMKYLVDKVIAPTGRTCNGTLLAQGDEVGDVWHLIVENNKVFTRKIDTKTVVAKTETAGDLVEVN